MHQPHLCNKLINSLFLFMPWINTVKLRLAFVFWLGSSLTEILKRGVPDYLPPTFFYIMFLFYCKYSFNRSWLKLPSFSNCSTVGHLMEVPLWYLDSRGARLKINCSSVMPKEMIGASKQFPPPFYHTQIHFVFSLVFDKFHCRLLIQ